jgi:hypothetical protein
MSKNEDNTPRQKPAKQGSIPERTHWILRKMIRQRYAELCGAASAVKSPSRKSMERLSDRMPPSDIC